MGVRHRMGSRLLLSSVLPFSEYAATAPAEDFAETFMLYVRHGDRLPAHHDTIPIRRKWRFIRDLADAMRSGRRKW